MTLVLQIATRQRFWRCSAIATWNAVMQREAQPIIAFLTALSTMMALQ
jgi:hypothetical protein